MPVSASDLVLWKELCEHVNEGHPIDSFNENKHLLNSCDDSITSVKLLCDGVKVDPGPPQAHDEQQPGCSFWPGSKPNMNQTALSRGVKPSSVSSPFIKIMVVLNNKQSLLVKSPLRFIGQAQIRPNAEMVSFLFGTCLELMSSDFI